jgi:hypothetical protein
LCKTNIRPKRRDRLQYNNSLRFQHPTFINRQIILTKHEQNNNRIKLYYRSNGLTRHLQNILTTVKCTFCTFMHISSAHENFSRIAQTFSHKTSLNKVKKIIIKIMPCIFFWLQLNETGNQQKKFFEWYQYMQTEKYTFEWIRKSGEKLTYFLKWWKHNIPKLVGCSKSRKREVYSNECPYLKK